jgi:hypothetical protein
MLAGVPGFEPGLSVLETDVLTVDTIPLQTLPIANFRMVIARCRNTSAIGNWQSPMLLGFLMTCVLAATSTKLGKLQPIGRGLLILSRHVVAALAFTTLEHNVIARHKSILFSDCHLPNCQLVTGR